MGGFHIGEVFWSYGGASAGGAPEEWDTPKEERGPVEVEMDRGLWRVEYKAIFV